MAVKITRAHPFPAGEVDGKMEQAIADMAAANSLAVTDKQPRAVKLGGMGVTAGVTWDEKNIAVEADMAFAFGAADTQLRGAIESALDRICKPA